MRYTYVISVRETVDTQYIVQLPNELPNVAIEKLTDGSGGTYLADLLSGMEDARFARNVREREIVDVTFTGESFEEIAGDEEK